ncbi:hypothetical protein HY483_03635 [Candidatus Woesearchaeota archaeon]|nr:hypothetical protein [Candidatus Woesearchaeota archaeon]
MATSTKYISEYSKHQQVGKVVNFIYHNAKKATEGLVKEPKEDQIMVILYDRNNLPEHILETIFATEQQAIVAKELVKYVSANKNEITKTDMSMFATKLHEGTYQTTISEGNYKGKKVKLSYNKRQFYDRILTPMKAMGLIDYDLYKKTYKLGSKFTNDLMKLGLQWKEELRKEGIEV